MTVCSMPFAAVRLLAVKMARTTRPFLSCSARILANWEPVTSEPACVTVEYHYCWTPVPSTFLSSTLPWRTREPHPRSAHRAPPRVSPGPSGNRELPMPYLYSSNRLKGTRSYSSQQKRSVQDRPSAIRFAALKTAAPHSAVRTTASLRATLGI